MKSNEIKSLSLKTLIANEEKYATGCVHNHRGCMVGRILATETPIILNDPIRIDALVMILCTQGSFQFNCNFKEHHAEEGSLVLIPPKYLISGSTPSINEGYILILAPDYLSECNFNMARLTSLMMQIAEQRCVKTSNEEQFRLTQAISMLDSLITEQRDSSFRDDIIRAAVETIMYLCCESFDQHVPKISATKLTRQESYFRQFIQLLNEHYTERLGVGFYAEQLCISPRYLTTIVRRLSGMTVTDWQEKYLIMEAKYLLKYSEMTIQEIAYRLSFPDQSFFGKYFRQHVGMSPSTYRTQH